MVDWDSEPLLYYYMWTNHGMHYMTYFRLLVISIPHEYVTVLVNFNLSTDFQGMQTGFHHVDGGLSDIVKSMNECIKFWWKNTSWIYAMCWFPHQLSHPFIEHISHHDTKLQLLTFWWDSSAATRRRWFQKSDINTVTPRTKPCCVLV